MPLTEDAFIKFNREDPTRDGHQHGRWIACDESGYDGEQLRKGSRYLVYASGAIDDVEAGEIVRELRVDSGVRQVPELKCDAFNKARWGRRREVLRTLWEPGGALYGRCAVYVVDKEYATVAKIVDLLLEEQAYQDGQDLYLGREARRLAWVLALQGRRSLRAEGFERLLDAFIAFASQRALGNEQEVTATFFVELDKAWAASKSATCSMNPPRGTPGTRVRSAGVSVIASAPATSRSHSGAGPGPPGSLHAYPMIATASEPPVYVSDMNAPNHSTSRVSPEPSRPADGRGGRASRVVRLLPRLKRSGR